MRGTENVGCNGTGHRDTSLLLSAEQLADLLQVSKRTSWRLRSSGRLPKHVLLGCNVRWRTAEIESWVVAGCPTLSEWDSRQKVGP
jgi:prophage regulatory protein